MVLALSCTSKPANSTGLAFRALIPGGVERLELATEDLTSWEDLHRDYWVVDPNNRCIWEWGTL